MTTTAKKQTTSRYGINDFLRNETMFKQEVEPRMKELLALNRVDTTKMGFGEDWKKHMNLQNTLINELEEHAFNARSMTGRFIKFPHADSFALYLIVKVNKTTCRLQWIDYMDGWVDDRLGESGSLPIDYVHSDICGQDNMKKLFGTKRVTE